MSVRFGRQFHNQPEESHQHRFLVDLWRDVHGKTGGHVDITVHARNAGVVGSDPHVLEMLVAGEVEFATMMGPLIGAQVPAVEIQGLPFAFRTSDQAHRSLDGPLGEYLRDHYRYLFRLGRESAQIKLADDGRPALGTPSG